MKILESKFVQGFIKMANDGYLQGWHEEEMSYLEGGGTAVVYGTASQIRSRLTAIIGEIGRAHV